MTHRRAEGTVREWPWCGPPYEGHARVPPRAYRRFTPRGDGSRPARDLVCRWAGKAAVPRGRARSRLVAVQILEVTELGGVRSAVRLFRHPVTPLTFELYPMVHAGETSFF